MLNKEAEEDFNFQFSDKNEELKKIICRTVNKVREKVSGPLDMSSSQVKKNNENSSAIWRNGVGIVQRQYQKLTVSKKGDLVTKTFSVEGRKHPLINIRKKLFTKYHKYMRLNNDSYFENLNEYKLHNRLKAIGEFNHDESLEFMRQKQWKERVIYKSGMMPL